jgi:hypothetical protein
MYFIQKKVDRFLDVGPLIHNDIYVVISYMFISLKKFMKKYV